MKLPAQVSESVKILNPEIFSPGLGAVHREVAQPNSRAALERLQLRTQSSQASGRARSAQPCLRVTIIAFTRRQLDGDNLQSGCKAMRDRVAEEFGLDDNDKTIDWQYACVATRGERGVILKIEAMPVFRQAL